jgi:hypothetical protein
MPEDPEPDEDQRERAARLRRQIERLKKGEPAPDDQPKSLREQIAEREREENK